MKRIMNHVILLLLFSSILFISSCMVSDSFHFTVNNDSNTSFMLFSSELGNMGIIKERESKDFKFWNKPSFITLDFKFGNNITKYIFRDVDHWLGVIHRIEINVNNEGIEFNGTRNEVFEIVE